MNDNMNKATSALAQQRERLAIMENAAANGRFGCLGMAAIALHQGAADLAFAFVFTLFLAWVVDQIEHRPFHMAASAVVMVYVLGLLAWAWAVFL